ncbi:MAG: cardiolipin synthase [Acholeplasmataceae bacterium]|nr:cardiolipin synthase [Acholeplasmataceae bacterium]
MKRIVRMLLSRTFLIMLLVLAQIFLFLYFIDFISDYQYVNDLFYVISVIIVIYLITKEENPVYKLSWIIPILIFPLFGGIFYLLYRQRNVSKSILKKHRNIDLNRYDYTHMMPNQLKTKDSVYLENLNWPTYAQTETKFLSSGEALFEAMKKDIEAAEKYIFLEFFIISPGRMWNEILELLKTKAKQGVEIKILYDDFGSSLLPYRYTKKLATYGIEAINFNPMRMHLNFAMNYRDHRKIIVIDGKVAYTGGINIGDEYINLTHPYGHWKDAGIRLEGDAVWSLIIGFLENWRFQTTDDIDYEYYQNNHKKESTGYIIPFTDTPLDSETTNKNIYLSLISQAQESILITSPYLIIDNELTTALKYASKAGVKVKIIIPYVPDKKIVFMVTESYVPELMEAGAEVYRYKPGFIHSKMMIVDGKRALIGTANLDFRSLYLHFENSVYLEQTPSIDDMVLFFNQTIEESITIKSLGKRNFIYRIVQILLRGFSSIL